MKIEDHPNSLLRREVEILKERVRQLEYLNTQHAKSMLIVHEKFDELKDIVKRALGLLNSIPILKRLT